MTPKSLSSYSLVLSPEQLTHSLRALLISLAGGLLALALVGDPSPWQFTPPELRLPRAGVIQSDVSGVAPAGSPGAPPAVVSSDKKVAALATYLAKKYRVSEAAVIDIVKTAYAEGYRIGLDPLLLVAVMAIESSFNPIAESVAGAKGLMQIIPRFHPDKFDADDSALDPDVNIRAGALALKEYIRRAGGLAGGLQIYNGSASDSKTSYANKVLSEQQRLKQVLQRARG